MGTEPRQLHILDIELILGMKICFIIIKFVLQIFKFWDFEMGFLVENRRKNTAATYWNYVCNEI